MLIHLNKIEDAEKRMHILQKHSTTAKQLVDTQLRELLETKKRQLKAQKKPRNFNPLKVNFIHESIKEPKQSIFGIITYILNLLKISGEQFMQFIIPVFLVLMIGIIVYWVPSATKANIISSFKEMIRAAFYSYGQ